MNRISRSLTTLYRTERLIARRRLAIIRKQTTLAALAGVLALIGLVLLNLSLYFVLQARMSGAAASGILAAANIALAGLLAFWAGRINVETEIAPAIELRDIAIADLEADVEDATSELRELANILKGLPKDPLGSLSALVLPLISLLLSKKK